MDRLGYSAARGRIDRLKARSKRRKILEVSTHLLMDWLRTERPEVASIDAGLPEDCEIVDCKLDFERPGVMLLLLESDAFEEVPLGGLIPKVESPIFHAAGPRRLETK